MSKMKRMGRCSRPTGRSWVSLTNGKRPHLPQPASLTFSISNIYDPKVEIFLSGIIVLLKIYLVTRFLWTKDEWNQQQHIGRLVAMPPLFFFVISILQIFLQFLALMMFWSIWKQASLDLGRLQQRLCQLLTGPKVHAPTKDATSELQDKRKW